MQNTNSSFGICGNSNSTFCELIPKYYPANENKTCFEGYVLKTYEYKILASCSFSNSDIIRCTYKNIKMFDYCVNEYSKNEVVDVNFIKKFSNNYEKTTYDSLWLWTPSNYYSNFNSHFYNYFLVYLNLFLTIFSCCSMFWFINLKKTEEINLITLLKLMIFSSITNILIPEIFRIFVNWNYNDSKYFINTGKYQYIESYEISIFKYIFLSSLLSSFFLMMIVNEVDNKKKQT